MKEIRKIATEFRSGILGRKSAYAMCLAVSAPLASYLQFCGYNCKLTEGVVGMWNHFWITLPDGTIIDPTADQFNSTYIPMPKIYIGPLPEHYKVAAMIIK